MKEIKEIKGIKGYHQLLVWQKARVLVKEIYELTRLLPKEELFGLTSQLRRAAVSIVANLVEGYSRGVKSKKESLQFYSISSGSLTEVEALLEIALDVYPDIVTSHYLRIENLRNEVAFLLNRFVASKR